MICGQGMVGGGLILHDHGCSQCKPVGREEGQSPRNGTGQKPIGQWNQSCEVTVRLCFYIEAGIFLFLGWHLKVKADCSFVLFIVFFILLSWVCFLLTLLVNTHHSSFSWFLTLGSTCVCVGAGRLGSPGVPALLSTVLMGGRGPLAGRGGGEMFGCTEGQAGAQHSSRLVYLPPVQMKDLVLVSWRVATGGSRRSL